MYCPICDKNIEQYGKRKTDLKTSGWTFCPKHGWIQTDVPKKETVLEKAIKSTKEKVPEEDIEQKTGEEQQEADFSVERESETTDLPTKRTKVFKNKYTIIGVIISSIFLMIALAYLLGNFSWKSSRNKSLEMKSSTAVVQVGTSDEQIRPLASRKAAISKRAKPETIFTVQVGAYSDPSYAETLKERLEKTGYNAYITTSELEKEIKFYKVYIGRFTDREKAESLCKIIKKRENLEAFVISR